LIVNNFKLLQSDLDFLKERIQREKSINKKEEKNIKKILIFLEELPTIRTKEPNSDILLIKKTKQEFSQDNLQG
jgi:hypothetical protein